MVDYSVLVFPACEGILHTIKMSLCCSFSQEVTLKRGQYHTVCQEANCTKDGIVIFTGLATQADVYEHLDWQVAKQQHLRYSGSTVQFEPLCTGQSSYTARQHVREHSHYLQDSDCGLGMFTCTCAAEAT